MDSRPLPDGPSSALPPDYWELLDALPYRLTNEQNAQLYSQWQIRTQQCVAALGFKDYVLSEYPAQSRPELNPLDLPSAERFGYHIAKPVLHSANDDLADRNPEYSRALFGAEGSPGCLQQTQDAVYGDQSKEPYIVDADSLSSSFAIFMNGFESTDQGIALSADWAQCMSKKGYDFASRIEAYGRFSESPEPTSDEIKVRLADHDCDVRVGLSLSKSNWLTSRYDIWLDENSEAIAKVMESKKQYIKRLASVP